MTRNESPMRRSVRWMSTTSLTLGTNFGSLLGSSAMSNSSLGVASIVNDFLISAIFALLFAHLRPLGPVSANVDAVKKAEISRLADLLPEKSNLARWQTSQYLRA